MDQTAKVRVWRSICLARSSHGGSISAALALYGIDRHLRLSTRLHARAATLIEARLLNIAEGSSGLHSSGLDAAVDGEPLQAVETAFAGDRIEVIVEPD